MLYIIYYLLSIIYYILYIVYHITNMNAYSGPKLRQGSLCKYPGRHAFPGKFPHTLQLPAGSLTNTMLAIVVQRQKCYACKTTKEESDMFVAIKAGTKGSQTDVWKCNACHALHSRINRLQASHGELVSGFKDMDQTTKDGFLARAATMFKGTLVKELSEAVH